MATINQIRKIRGLHDKVLAAIDAMDNISSLDILDVMGQDRADEIQHVWGVLYEILCDLHRERTDIEQAFLAEQKLKRIENKYKQPCTSK
jgi:hypothetical protein